MLIRLDKDVAAKLSKLAEAESRSVPKQANHMLRAALALVAAKKRLLR